MPSITFKICARSYVVPAKTGQTLLDVALDHEVPLEHNCGGSCACTTCHVIIKEGMTGLSEMSEAEEDRLDSAEGLTLTSRLGCQAVIQENAGDVVVEIPI